MLLERYGDKVSFAFRYFPIDESCNTGVSGYTTKNEGSCYLSKLVEAVFVIGGVDARWEMHDWIMGQGGPINPGVATAFAAGIVEEDTKTVRAVTNSAEVSNRMRLDILSKNQVRKRGVPTLTIDENWFLSGGMILLMRKRCFRVSLMRLVQNPQVNKFFLYARRGLGNRTQVFRQFVFHQTRQ